jgi:hypothetical protein
MLQLTPGGPWISSRERGLRWVHTNYRSPVRCTTHNAHPTLRCHTPVARRVSYAESDLWCESPQPELLSPPIGG